MFDSPFQESLLKKAQDRGLINIAVHDLRTYTHDRHRTADDTPYGGGAGMVMKAPPIVAALEALREPAQRPRVVLTSPQGGALDQARVRRLAGYGQVLIVCGRYEGVDERVLQFVDEEISVGDFILAGGELPAMMIVDAVSRLVPGVVGDRTSVAEDTFAGSLLKHPQYTRPRSFRGMEVPEVLLSGDHRKIEAWRRAASLRKTIARRPDLLELATLNETEKQLVQKLKHAEAME